MSETGKPAEPSFLSRWSRRKVDAATQDQAGAAPALRPAPLPVMPSTSTGAAASEKSPETPHPEPTLPSGSQVKTQLPSIESLTHDADFSPFMAGDVDPGLRNQAMKKLFSNPHYQFAQMDKLDIYIDDYSQPDPIPMEMLRQMNQAKSLLLFDDEEEAAPPQPGPAAGGQEDTALVVPGSNSADKAGTGTDGESDALNAPSKTVEIVDPSDTGRSNNRP